MLAALLGAYTFSDVIFAVAPDYAVAVVARTIGGLAHAGFFAVAVVVAAALAALAGVVVRLLPVQAPTRTTSRTPVLMGIRRPAVLIMATVITLLALTSRCTRT